MPNISRFLGRGRLSSIVATLLIPSLLLAQTPPPPTITSLSPSTVSIGMPVTITGTDFFGNITVRFGNATATGSASPSGDTVTATVPTSLTAAGNIVITAAGGNSTNSVPFGVDFAPKLTGFYPSNATNNEVVTVSGYNLSGTVVGNRTITVNGTAVTTTIVATGNQVSFAVPANATSGPIAIATAQGTVTSTNFLIVAAGTPPANDQFANATFLGNSPSGGVGASSANATAEFGEPNHAGSPARASVWFRWIAPSSGLFLFTPQASNYGTNLAVYVGDSLGALSPIASGTSASPAQRFASAVGFNAIAGTTYHLALDGYNGLMGNYSLSWSPLPALAISNLSRTSSFAGEWGALTISGAGFTPAATVRIGGVAVPTARRTVNSATSITVNPIPLNAALGAAPVIVETLGQTAASAQLFNVTATPAPVISSFSPTQGSVGANVTILGTALVVGDGAPSIKFNGTAASSVSVVTSGNISARVPTGATTGPITVTTPAGNVTSNTTFTVVPPVFPPTIASVTPGGATIGSTVTITGSNLSNTTSVSFNGTPGAISSLSNTTLSVSVPVGATSGPLTVITPGGSATTSAPFAVIPTPVVTSFSPTALAPNMRVVISGSGFSETQNVTVGGSLGSVTVDSDTQLTVRLGGGALQPGPIIVSTANAMGASTSNITVLPPEAPSIAALSTNQIGAGQTITLDGSGFSHVTSVSFNGSSSFFTVLSPTRIEARAPSESSLSPGRIAVTTTQGSALSPAYTLSLAPVITSVVPAEGPNGRVIIVNGANFSGTGISSQLLRFNNTSIGSFSRGANTWAFAIPANATSGPITITTNQGATASAPIDVGPGAAPANDHFASSRVLFGSSGLIYGNTANATRETGEPNHVNHTAGGGSVWFTWTAPASGLYLFNPSNSSSSQFGIIQAIYTGDTLATLTQVASGLPVTTTIMRYQSAAVLDAVAGTTYRIALAGANGLMADYRLQWNPLSAPTIASFSPANGEVGSITLNIVGGQFPPGAAVAINGTVVDPSQITYQNPSQITVRQIPAGATSGPITVTTAAGTATSLGHFIVGPLPPVISSFSPDGAKVGTPVTISGGNFAGTLAVLFNGIAANSFSVSSNNTVIQTQVPEAASSGPISVITNGGQAVSSTPFVVIVPPVVIEHPQSQTVPAFGNVTFSARVSSNGPEEYQWLKNGGPILGNPTADTPNLNIPRVTVDDLGLYTCRIGNNAGFVTTNAATLALTKLPLEVTLTPLAATYDGAPKPVVATTAVPAAAVEVRYGDNLTPPTNAGSYPVAATIVDPHYAGSATGTLVISPAPVTITLGDLAHTYDGMPKAASASATPAVALQLSYDGSTAPVVDAGRYLVLANVTDPNYTGSASGTLTISPASAMIALAPLVQRYDGTPRTVNVVTTPPDLPVAVTYDGATAAPVYPGSYIVNAAVQHRNYTGNATDTLGVGITALVRQAPTLSGELAGSLQVVSPEDVSLDGNALIAQDLLVPGTPELRISGQPTFASVIDANGDSTPSLHQITLRGSVLLRHLVRRVDPLLFPTVAAPAPSAGTRDVRITSPAASIGEPATLRDLTLTGQAGTVTLPPGTYRNLDLGGQTTLVLGDAAATTQYAINRLTLGSEARVQLLGPVVLTIADSLSVQGGLNGATAPHLTVRIAGADVRLQGNATAHADLIAPAATVRLEGSAMLTGTLVADRLLLAADATLIEAAP